MRKRRRLADKLTIMVCAVFVAVSAFFYSPMDVFAFENNGTLSPLYQHYTNQFNVNITNTPLGNSFQSETYYDVVFTPNYVLSSDYFSFMIRDLTIVYDSECSIPLGEVPDDKTFSDGFYTISRNTNVRCVLKGKYLNATNYLLKSRILCGDLPIDSFNYKFSFTPVLVSAVPLTGEQSSSYQQGYNSGYSAGEQVGESIGYSNGYSDGYEAGEQSGYDSGFQAGQESVDTQSYYDMGYSAGYDAGYSSGYDDGYDDGYDAGWSAYEAQMDKWGADTSDYPKQVAFQGTTSTFCEVIVSGTTSTALPYQGFSNWDISGVNFNPNHTYKIRVVLDDNSYDIPSAVYTALRNNYYLNIGGSKYALKANSHGTENYFFVPGDRMSNILKFIWEPFFYTLSGNNYLCRANLFLTFTVYDMGPIGDTQNHIANQTDQLTGGYNDSQGNSVNNDFSTGLNEFETAEDSLFSTATTGLKDFTFFDFQSVPAMVTGMSFVGSIMSGWFTQAGGASGVGIVLSILFSIMLVAMVLGLYRWYQSKGGKD